MIFIKNEKRKKKLLLGRRKEKKFFFDARAQKIQKIFRPVKVWLIFDEQPTPRGWCTPVIFIIVLTM